MGDSAVALRYAEALYALAKEKGRAAEVLADLAELKRALDAAPDAWRKLLHPRVSAAEKRKLLDGNFLGPRDRYVANALRVIVQRGREGILPGFFATYLSVHEAKEGILRVEVETATPLGDAEREALRAKVAETTGRPVVLEARTVPELLGGMRILVGSSLVDGSVRSRLERIRRGLRSVAVSGK